MYWAVDLTWRMPQTIPLIYIKESDRPHHLSSIENTVGHTNNNTIDHPDNNTIDQCFSVGGLRTECELKDILLWTEYKIREKQPLFLITVKVCTLSLHFLQPQKL